MYIWLVPDGVQRIEELKNEGKLGKNVRADEDYSSGKKHVSIWGDPFDPTTSFPDIPQEIIERVTHKDRIHCGFRTEGVYVKEKTTALVRGESKLHSEMMMQGPVGVERWQEISISAPTIAAAKEMYTLIREGLLLPEKKWGEFSDAPVTVPEF